MPAIRLRPPYPPYVRELLRLLLREAGEQLGLVHLSITYEMTGDGLRFELAPMIGDDPRDDQFFEIPGTPATAVLPNPSSLPILTVEQASAPALPPPARATPRDLALLRELRQRPLTHRAMARRLHVSATAGALYRRVASLQERGLVEVAGGEYALTDVGRRLAGN